MTDGMFQVLPSFDCEGLLEIFEIRSGVRESICLYQNLTKFVWSWLSWLFSISFFSVCLFVCLVLLLMLFFTPSSVCYPLPQLRAGDNLFLSLSFTLSPRSSFIFVTQDCPLIVSVIAFVSFQSTLVWSLSRFHILWDGNFTLRTCDPSIWLCCILGQVCF